MERKVVAVTGGATSVGLALARLLASQGAFVSIADNSREEQLAEAVASIKEASPHDVDVLATRVDVREVEQVGQWLAATVDKLGPIDHVANASSIWRGAAIDEQDEDMWDLLIGANLAGAMHVLLESAKIMEPDSGCTIVVVASIAGLDGLPGQGVFTASMHGVVGLVRSMAKELSPRNIRVNCVAPSICDLSDTTLGDETAGLEISNGMARMSIGVGEDPLEVAKVAAFLLSDESRSVTGSVLTVNGGLQC